MSHPQTPVEVDRQHGNSPARRKLIRGVFALPAVAAVHSGSALAATSSLRCLGNGPTGPNAPGVILAGTIETPMFLRVELIVAGKDLSTSSPLYRYFVAGSKVQAVATARGVGVGPFITLSTFLLFNISTNTISGSQLTVVTADGYAQITPTPADKKYFAVLMFNADGTQIVGVGNSSATDVHAATESCWTSFTP